MSDRNQLIEAELAGLRRYARALAATSDDANDLVQETVSRALLRWEQWRGLAPRRAWLFAIMRNIFYQEGRRLQRWRTVSIDDAPQWDEPAAPEGPDPLLLRDVRNAVDALSADQRETLFLVAVEGMSYAEAAELTNVPIGTVMSRLSRARASVRQMTDGM